MPRTLYKQEHGLEPDGSRGLVVRKAETFWRDHEARFLAWWRHRLDEWFKGNGSHYDTANGCNIVHKSGEQLKQLKQSRHKSREEQEEAMRLVCVLLQDRKFPSMDYRKMQEIQDIWDGVTKKGPEL